MISREDCVLEFFKYKLVFKKLTLVIYLFNLSNEDSELFTEEINDNIQQS